MAKSTIPADKLERYDQLIASFSGFERKGKTVPYTSTNTYMFTFLDKEGVLCVRLGSEDVEEFIAKYDTKNTTQNGRIMKDFVEIPESVFKSEEEIRSIIQRSFDHTNTLKPKKKK